MLRVTSSKQVQDRIRFENPWWVNGHIEEEYDEMPRRLYFALFKPLVFEKEINRAVVLMGPSRVGKTVMLHHMVEDLIQNGTDPRKIIFISIDNPIYHNISLEQLLTYSKEATGIDDHDDWHIIIDEIQYYRDWEIDLKALSDTYKGDKFIVASALRVDANDSGSRRFTNFLLPPLSFHEYISFKGLDHIIKPIDITWKNKKKEFYTSSHLDELNKHFIDYINFGGYPEVIFSEKTQSNPGRYIRQEILDKVLLRDLPSLYGINDTQELNALFTTIANNSAGAFSLEALSNQCQVPKNTLKKYLDYLEAAFLIKRVRRIDQSGKQFKRDNFFKIYLTNPSLRSALFSPITATDEMIGNMVETAIFSQWMHKEWFMPWYARWSNGEVNLVGLGKTLKPIWALEIKWSNLYFDMPNELKSLIKFCQENDVNSPIVTTIDKEGEKECKEVHIQYLPSSSYAYSIGKNTIDGVLIKNEQFAADSLTSGEKGEGGEDDDVYLL